MEKKEPYFGAYPVSDEQMSDEFSCKTKRLDLGADFAAVFFCRLFGWLQLNKKLRIVVEYDPEDRTKVKISRITNDPNEKCQ